MYVYHKLQSFPPARRRPLIDNVYLGPREQSIAIQHLSLGGYLILGLSSTKMNDRPFCNDLPVQQFKLATESGPFPGFRTQQVFWT